MVLPQQKSFWLFFIIMGVLGVGYGLSVTTTTVEAQASVPKGRNRGGNLFQYAFSYNRSSSHGFTLELF